MIFNGFPIWFAVLLAAAGCGGVMAAHFLKMRARDIVVPTTLFWQQAAQSQKRIVWPGKITALMTLLFLLAIVLMLVFATLNPMLKPLKKAIVIIDTSPATDLPSAQDYARQLIRQSDQTVLLAVDNQVTTCSRFGSERHLSLAAVDKLSPARSAYSAVTQAVKEARAIDPTADIYVLTGQAISVLPEIQTIRCPSNSPVLEDVGLSVAFQTIPEVVARAFCASDERFVYCPDSSAADVVLADTHLSDMDWRSPQFVPALSHAVELTAGISGRTPVRSMAALEKDERHRQGGWPFHRWLLLTVLVLVILEICLVQRGKLL